MRPENIIWGVLFFGFVITIGGLFYASEVEKGGLTDTDDAIFTDVRVEAGKIYESGDAIKDDIYGTGLSEDDSEDISVGGAFKSAKTAFSATSIARNVTVSVVKDSGWEGMSYLGNFFIIFIVIGGAMFMMYFLRGYKPQ